MLPVRSVFNDEKKLSIAAFRARRCGCRVAARGYAAELIRKSPDVILANGPVPTLELQKMTRSTPIVFVQVPDPVDFGVVMNIARPGANITGFTHFEMAFAGKSLEALKEIAPSHVHVACRAPRMAGFLRTITGSAPSFGVEIVPAPVSNAAESARSKSWRASRMAGCYRPARLPRCIVI